MNAATSDIVTDNAVARDYVSVADMPKLLSKQEIKYFSRVNGWMFAGAVALELATIALTIWLCEHFWNPFGYVIAVIILGSRQHALGILMHDAAHYRAFTNRRLNDFFGELLAWPLTLTLQGYRNSHSSHHRELNTENDLEWARKMGQKEFTFPKTRGEIVMELLRFASGINAYKELADAQKIEKAVYVSPKVKVVRMAVYLALVFASGYFGFWPQLLMYWIVPLITSLLFFAHVRAVSDHFCVEYTHPLNQTRTVVCPLWESHLFAPYGINYHIEHHNYPGVPFYRLGELHRHLMTKDDYIRHAHVTKGYWGLLRECLASESAVIQPAL